MKESQLTAILLCEYIGTYVRMWGTLYYPSVLFNALCSACMYSEHIPV